MRARTVTLTGAVFDSGLSRALSAEVQVADRGSRSRPAPAHSEPTARPHVLRACRNSRQERAHKSSTPAQKRRSSPPPTLPVEFFFRSSSRMPLGGSSSTTRWACAGSIPANFVTTSTSAALRRLASSCFRANHVPKASRSASVLVQSSSDHTSIRACRVRSSSPPTIHPSRFGPGT